MTTPTTQQQFEQPIAQRELARVNGSAGGVHLSPAAERAALTLRQPMRDVGAELLQLGSRAATSSRRFSR
jgi:hypothetical protein